MHSDTVNRDVTPRQGSKDKVGPIAAEREKGVKKGCFGARTLDIRCFRQLGAIGGDWRRLAAIGGWGPFFAV